MVFGRFSKAKPPREEKMSGAAQFMDYLQLPNLRTGLRDASSVTRSGFMRNPVAYRCVQLTAESAAHIKLNLQDQQLRYDEHPLIDLMRRPNPSQSNFEFFEALYCSFLLTGQAYIEARYDDEGQVQALYLLRSDRVRVILGNDGWPVAYEFSVNGQKTQYPIVNGVSQVLQIRSFHPQNDHYGFSSAVAAAHSIEVHNAASAWSKALLENAARPSGAIVYQASTPGGQMTQTQFDRLKDEMESYHQGARNAGRPMLLEGGLDWKPMGFSPSDMEFHRTKETAAREIALAFGVPPMLLGIPGDNTYANYQEAKRGFYRATVLPLVERVISKLNFWLIDDERLNFAIDMEGITALASERESEWRRISGASFISDDEKRKILGFPAREADDA